MHTTHPLSRIIREIVYEANIDVPMGENPTNYLIKRTSITRQLKECPDPKIIQMQAGHSKLATTMRYNRVSDDDRRKYFGSKREGYRKNPHVKIPEVSEDYVLKTTGDLPQDLNKIKGGELKDNNTSFSFSVSFYNFFGTEQADGVFHNISLLTRSPHIFIECFSPSASEMPIDFGGVFFE